MKGRALRAYYRALGVGCFGAWITACSGDGPARLAWEIEFACPADAANTEKLTFRVRTGGCSGEAVYTADLARGGTVPSKLLDPGSYGLEVVASDAAGAALASDCSVHDIPASETIQLTLRSASCVDGAIDAMVPDAMVEVDAEPQCMPPEDCRPCAQDGDPTDCPPTSCTEQTLAGHSYLFCVDKQQWAGARTECRKLGRDLAIIETAEENAFLTTHINGSIHWIGANDRGSNGLGSCRKSGDEGTWRWVNPVSGSDQGTNFCNASSNSSSCNFILGQYMNWSPGEPNNDNCTCYPFAPCDEGEDCAAISASGSWQDQGCRAALPYICESY